MKRSIFHFSSIAVLFLISLFSITTISAQEFRGTITGTIKDPNEAVVPGATVTLQNIATNVTATVKANDEGGYTFPLVSPGKYKITATADNFKTSVRESVELNVDDRLTVDLQLEIGTTTQVNVVAETELVERGSVTTGTVITNRQVEELPLAEGAPYVLATQAPGVVYTGNPQFTGPTANGNLAGFRSNGAAGNQINLDGSPNLSFSGQVAFTPPSDAVQEFKVQTNSFDAQNGFTAGSTVNVAIKSGTNKLHGTAYYYDRDKSRTANNFFNNRLGQDRPDRKYKRYGFTLNGPVRIPFFYNGKDKTFFMFAYERQLDNVAEPTLYTVPTTLMRNGDFSELIVDRTNIASASNTIIYNPFSGTTSGSNVVRTSFGCPTTGAVAAGSTCNILPASLVYQPALKFLQLFPSPNLPGTVNNYFSNTNLVRPYRSYLARIDHNFNSNNRVFGKYFRSANTEDRYNFIGTPTAVTRGYEYRRNFGGNVDYTSILSSNFIVDVRASYNKFTQRRAEANPTAPAALGFAGIAGVSTSTEFPRFDFRNYTTLGSLRSDYNEGLVRPFDLFSIQPTVTQIYKTHTFKYGYDYRRLHEKSSTNGYNSGRFLFDGTYTAPASNSSSTLRNVVGRDLAAFLLGIPTASSSGSIIDTPTAYDARSAYNAVFIQDDWRATPKLTFNLGLRYELESGVKEAQGRIVTGFDLAAASPLRAGALANYNSSVPSGVSVTAFQNLAGGLTFASSGNDANQSTDKNNFQPRIGVSYSLNNKTVIRGGFGIFTAPFQIQPVTQSGFSTPTLFTPTTNNGLTFTSTLANPFPGGVAAAPGASLGLATFAGRDLITTNSVGPTSVILSHDRKNANYARFVFGIQRELPFKLGFEATFVHSSGYNLGVSRQINYIPRENLLNFSGGTDSSTIAALITAQTTFLNATVPNPFRGLIPSSATYNAATIQRRLLLVPFPQFGNVAVTEYNGTSKYNSLQFQVVRRFSKGLSFNASYTFSRELEKDLYLNPQDSAPTETIGVNDRPHRVTFSSVYELPFGRGRLIGKGWNRLVDAFLGGWQLNTVYEWQSGEPLQFPNSYFNGDPTQLVNKLGKKDSQGRKYGVDIPAFDIGGFYLNGVVNTANAPGYANNYTLGSTVVLRNLPLTMNNFRNQRFLKLDAGLTKNFRIREGMKLQIRIEAINLPNVPYFTAPNLDPTNATFGFTSSQRQPPRDIQLGARFSF